VSHSKKNNRLLNFKEKVMQYDPSTYGLNILLVDDEQGIRTLISRYAQSRNCKATECASAEEALALPEKTRYDVVITDIRMGRMDGLDLAEKLRDAIPSAAVIIMTGFHSEIAVGRSRDMGAIYYLRKPFGMQELGDTLELAANWSADMLLQLAAQRFLELKGNPDSAAMPIRTEITEALKKISDSKETLRQFVYDHSIEGNPLLEALNQKFPDSHMRS
jgi:DNA-binding response OmpR family regulator